MHVDTCQFDIHVHSLELAKSFYVDILGLDLLEIDLTQNLLALRAGAVRISIIEDAMAQEVSDAAEFGGRVVFRADNLTTMIRKLETSKIDIPPIAETPGFMRSIEVRDPSGNPVIIAEYLSAPLERSA